MNVWQIVKSLFTFQPPPNFRLGSEENNVNAPSENSAERADNLPLFSEMGPTLNPKEKVSLAKIWIDNTFRVWVLNLTFVLCWGLWMAGTIPSFKAIVAIYFLYFAVELGATVLILRTKNIRQIDFFLCTVDILGISAGIYFTGGSSSPLYFLYFIPLIIQSFHRDWALILFYGFGGVICYSLITFFSAGALAKPDLVKLGTRIFFMGLTLSTAILAVSLLRRQIRSENIRLSRMKLLSQTSQILNRTTSLKEIPESIRDIVGLINNEFCPEIKGWSRAFLLEETGNTMKSLVDSNHNRLDLKQEIPSVVCPAVKNNSRFILNDANTESHCPTESFSFKSHLCTPISGAGNEVYGILFCGSDRPNSFKTQETEFLKFIARAIGLTLQRLRRVEELQLSLEMDSCAMATYMASTKGMDKTYKSILDGIKAILKSDHASLLVWEPTSGKLVTKESVGKSDFNEFQWSFHMGEGIPGRALESGKMVRTSEIQKEAPYNSTHVPYKSIICLPLHTFKGEPIGVVNVWYAEKGDDISAYEIDIASTFITRAILAIENASLHKKHSGTQKPEVGGQEKAA